MGSHLRKHVRPISSDQFAKQCILPEYHIETNSHLQLRTRTNNFSPMKKRAIVPSPIRILSISAIHFAHFNCKKCRCPSVQLCIQFHSGPSGQGCCHLVVRGRARFRGKSDIVAYDSVCQSRLGCAS